MGLLQRLFSNNLRPYGSPSGHQFFQGLRLELDNGFGQHRVHRSCCTAEGFCALFDLQAQQLKALGVHHLPVLTAGLVCLEQSLEFQGNALALVHLNNLGQVVIKANLVCLVLANLNNSTAILFQDDLDLRHLLSVDLYLEFAL